ncbi:hypothetical protein PR048_030542 [Dryococelus australis]|uniref:Uncharacterized protein n=1 Tax=Dryococelus australis TaxID=614101 RepID=A0ABQ9GD46_9NEOP|nr:hypothetical protein PR048_030542 [Dryococelus australis]
MTPLFGIGRALNFNDPISPKRLWALSRFLRGQRNKPWRTGGGNGRSPIKTPSTNGIVRHDPHWRKSGDPGRGLKPRVRFPGAAIQASYCNISVSIPRDTLGHGVIRRTPVRLLVSQLCEPCSIPGGSFWDFRTWESCPKIPLVGGVPPPPLHSGAAPSSPHFTLIGSQDLDVKSRTKYLHSICRIWILETSSRRKDCSPVKHLVRRGDTALDTLVGVARSAP